MDNPTQTVDANLPETQTNTATLSVSQQRQNTIDSAPLPASQKKTSKKRLMFLLIIIVLLAIGTGLWLIQRIKARSAATNAMTTKPLKHIVVQLSWFHTAEFAGFYIAQDKGFYKNVGLDVSLVEANPPQPSQDVLIAGKADFGIAGIDGIMLAREKGYPMKALAAIYQQSPVTFITLKNSGIQKPQDFVGKRVTIECGSNAEYQEWAVLKKLQLDTKIIKNCSTYDINQLLHHDTDVFAGFVTNESIEFELGGHPVNNILVTDYGVNYYPNLIFTSEDRIKNDPTTVKNFVKATLQGYSYALAHPEEAVDATMKQKSKAGLLSRALQTRTMAVQSPLIFIGKTPLGWMDRTVIAQGIDILLQQGIIKKAENPDAVFTNAYISSQ